MGSKITADSDCSHIIKRHLLLGRNIGFKPRQHIREETYMTNLDSVLKSRDITLLTKVHIVKAWFF